MLVASYQDPSMMYNGGQQVYNSTESKVNMVSNAYNAQAFQQASSNASTWSGSDMDAPSSPDSAWAQSSPDSPWAQSYQDSYCQNTQPMGYMMQGGYVAHQHQEQGYVVPVPMMPMVMAVIPTAMSTAMPMPVMAGMQAIPVASPQGQMLQGMNEAVQMDEQLKAFSRHMSAMQVLPAASPAGPTSNSGSEPSQTSEQLPAGQKPGRLLEDLLPRGRRATSARENLSRKIFVGGLNPSTTTEDLRSYFSSFGTVADSCVITDTINKESRGFGFVEFEAEIPEGLLDKQHIIDQRRCGVREYSTSS